MEWFKKGVNKDAMRGLAAAVIDEKEEREARLRNELDADKQKLALMAASIDQHNKNLIQYRAEFVDLKRRKDEHQAMFGEQERLAHATQDEFYGYEPTSAAPGNLDTDKRINELREKIENEEMLLRNETQVHAALNRDLDIEGRGYRLKEAEENLLN